MNNSLLLELIQELLSNTMPSTPVLARLLYNKHCATQAYTVGIRKLQLQMDKGYHNYRSNTDATNAQEAQKNQAHCVWRLIATAKHYIKPFITHSL